MPKLPTDEILEALRQISREKSVDRKLLIETLEAGLLSAAKKKYATAADVQVAFDEATGEIRVRVHKKVVQVAIDLAGEIDFEEAQKIDPGIRLGATVPVEVPVLEFGRNAVQAAKQVLVQRVREAERENVYQEYQDKVGQILSGTVSQVDRGSIIVKIGRTEGICPPRDLMFRDRFKIGDPVRVLLKEIDRNQKGPMLILSRTHEDFVKRLFENEVPEIFERVVEIREIAREPGSRTKIAVVSHDDRVDPVGACVGMKGQRVQGIVRELGGERIDIVPWSPDPKILISRALSPARVLDVLVNEDDRNAVVIVSDDQLSLAIGRNGQNARLAHRLTGYGIDLKSQSQVDLETTGEGGIPEIDLEDHAKQIGPRMVERLIASGKETLQDVLRTSIEELMEIPGIGEKTAGRLLSTARQILDDLADQAEKGTLGEMGDEEISEEEGLDAAGDEETSEEDAPDMAGDDEISEGGISEEPVSAQAEPDLPESEAPEAAEEDPSGASAASSAFQNGTVQEAAAGEAEDDEDRRRGRPDAEPDEEPRSVDPGGERREAGE